MLNIKEMELKTVVNYEIKVSDNLYKQVEFSIQNRSLKDLHKQLTKLCKEKSVKIERAKNGSFASHLKQFDTYIQEIHNPLLNKWLDDLNSLDYLKNDLITIEQYKEVDSLSKTYPIHGSGKYAVYSYIEKLYKTYDDMIERVSSSNTLSKISLSSVDYTQLEYLINKYK